MKAKGRVMVIMVCAGLLAWLGMGLIPGDAAAKTLYRMSTGSAGGVYQILGAGMSKVISQYAPDIDMTAITPPNVNQIPHLLESGQVLIGIGMVDMMNRAAKGLEEFKGRKFDKIVPILAMYDNAMAYLVLKNSPIISIKDVIGRRMSASSQYTKFLAAETIKAAGLDPNKVNWRFMSYQEGAEALSDGNIDVEPVTGFPKSGLVDQVMSTKGARFVEIDEATRQAFNKVHPTNLMMQTPPNTYTGQTKAAWGHGVYTVLYGMPNSDPQIIYNIVKAILDHPDDLSALHPSGKYITPERTKIYIEQKLINPAQLHPGAVRYFREKGIIK
jgi:TRAP transporter TAXI family solute receptor